MGRIGVWASEFRFADEGFVSDAAAELEEIGYGALWFPGGRGGDVQGAIARLLQATRSVSVATGILNIWMHEPAEVGGWWRDFADNERGRIMLGLGVGHAPAIGEAWKKPLEKMTAYFDGLDIEGFPAEHRCLAALGPKMLDLARERSAGAHPYLVTPEHTAGARQRLGPDALLAPEQGVILDSDPESARRKAREHLATYTRLPNYVNSWRRMGFGEADIAGVSDEFVDALFAWGSPEQIAARLAAHLDAGADHVCLQLVTGPTGSGDPEQLREGWRELAPGNLGF
ncbi:MAG: LLM class F420-dependent oxidoreductase [Novosphingobium sp.]|nr:LLM class F420-dependent oxidoreductase [Novosphingobium sp.]